MKKIYRTFMAAAFAAMALSSCVKGPEAVPATADNTVFFTAEPVATRTAFTDPEGTSYPTVWTGNDQSVAISLKLANPKEALVSPSADGKTAAFTASFSESPEAPYVFYLLSPYSAYLSTYSSTESIGITVPAVQTPGPKSVDEAAQILLAKSAAFDTWPGKVSFALKHWTSYGKLSLQNLKLDGAKISALDLTASVDWAGRWYYSFADGVSTVNSGSKTITVNTESTDDIWFACAPVDLSGETLTLVVKTDKGTFTKEIKMPADRKFESGQVARFAVDMKDVELVPSAVYELVTDMKDLTYDSKVIIAAAAPEYGYAIGTTQNNNNRASAGVTKVDGKISDPAENVEVFIVESGTESGTYSLKATGHAGYLIGVSGNNYLRTEAEKSAASDWKITCEEGTYSIIENAMSGRFIRFNPSSNNIFSTYAASSSVKNPVALYKLAGSGGGDVPADKKSPGMVLTCTELTLNVGDTGDVSVTEIARDYDGEITYVSGNTAVATVDAEGIVTAVAAGTCTVTVTAKETETFKSEVLTCAVTVKSTDAKALPYEEPLTSSLGDFTIVDKTLPEGLKYVWGNKPSGFAKASAYYSSTNYKAESWLVSPLIGLSSETQAYLTFSYALNYGVAASYSDQFYLMVNDGTSWTKVPVPDLPEKGSWTFYDVVVDLSSFCGKNIQFAFVYNSTTVNSALTIELNNVRVATEVKGYITMPSTMSLLQGGDAQKLNATSNSGAAISFSSSDPGVAAVSSDGAVTPVAPGTATITASMPAVAYYSAATATCEVTVTEASSPVFYKLDGTVIGGSNGYADESDIEQNGISWKVTGNTTISPWRIGGKSLDGVERPVYNVTPLAKDITKVVIYHGTMADITVNSVKLIVSKNADFSEPVDSLTGTAAANSELTFARPDGHSWDNCYFKIVYNLTVSVSSNKFVQLKAVEFYQN